MLVFSKVLRAMNFSVITVDVLCIEADQHDKERNVNIHKHLTSLDYEYHGRVYRNMWFVRRYLHLCCFMMLFLLF